MSNHQKHLVFLYLVITILLHYVFWQRKDLVELTRECRNNFELIIEMTKHLK